MRMSAKTINSNTVWERLHAVTENKVKVINVLITNHVNLHFELLYFIYVTHPLCGNADYSVYIRTYIVAKLLFSIVWE